MNYIIFLSFGFTLVLLIVLRSRLNFQQIKKKSKIRQYTTKDSNINTKKIDIIYLSKNEDLLFYDHFFSQKRIVITGDFIHFKTRNELAKLLWECGAVIETKLDTNTDILIVGKSNIDSLKLKYAIYLNIKIVTEDEVLSFFPSFKLEHVT